MLTDMTEKIVSPLIDETSQTCGTGQRRSRSVKNMETEVQLVYENGVLLGMVVGFYKDACLILP